MRYLKTAEVVEVLRQYQSGITKGHVIRAAKLGLITAKRGIAGGRLYWEYAEADLNASLAIKLLNVKESFRNNCIGNYRQSLNSFKYERYGV